MAGIELNNVSVEIPIYDIASKSLRRLMFQKAVGGNLAQVGSHLVISALKNITLSVGDGSRIGLVGGNGSGKTTLLRVIAGIYPPTAGTISVTGRVSPMFETTLGMDLDATGLENIRICGVLRGLTGGQVEASVDDIAEFSELGDYLSMPIRTYSSGMQLRLAFAIATVVEPEILLLDEAIGVGDATFFQKAQARLMKLVSRSRILMVASHSQHMIRELCDTAIWLQQGTLIKHGPVGEVLDAYLGGTSVAPPV